MAASAVSEASISSVSLPLTIPAESVQLVFITPKNQLYTGTGIAAGTDESFSLSARINMNAGDVGKSGMVFLAALAGDTWYFNDGVNWAMWAGGQLPAWYSGALPASFIIPILKEIDVRGVADIKIFAGYGLSSEDMLSRNLYSLIYSFSKAQ